MARIRTIKPEFWTSEQVADCSTTSRLLFVGMWNFVDDQGVHPLSMKQLKMEVFPGDPFTTEQMQEWFDELLHNGLVRIFEAEDRQYFVVTGWHHQKIEKPRNRYPAPPPIENSTTNRRPIDDQSTTSSRGVDTRTLPNTTEPQVDKERTVSCPESENPTSGQEPSSHQFEVDGGEGTWTLPQIKLDEYVAAFPNLDVERQMELAAGWIRNNPTKRKTARGMPRFLFSWLSRAQETPRRGATKTSLMDNPEIQAWLNQ